MTSRHHCPFLSTFDALESRRNFKSEIREAATRTTPEMMVNNESARVEEKMYME